MHIERYFATSGLLLAFMGFSCSSGSGHSSTDNGGNAPSNTGGNVAAGGGSSAGANAGLVDSSAAGSSGAGGSALAAGGSGSNAQAGSSGSANSGQGGSTGNPSAGSTAAGTASTGGAPTGLMIELTAHPELMLITDATPELSWIVNAAGSGAVQSAYRVLVASTEALLDAGTGDLWDSGKVASNASVNVAYAGKALTANASAFWKVQTWDVTGEASGFSTAQRFTMAATLTGYSTPSPSVVQTPVAPKVAAIGAGHYFLDFGRAAFGWLELTFNAPMDGAALTVNLGEKANGQAVDLAPGNSIRHASVQLTTQKGMHTYRVATPKNATNTKSPPAIPLPSSLGVVMPFRYVEVIGAPVTIDVSSAQQIALSYPFDDSASAFSSSNSGLDQVWDLAKYRIKATTFAGTYIDGDRERTPYEADAHLQQLGHYSVDRDYAIARASHEYLMTHPTWPTEWKFHSIMLAWTDWMYTGNTESLAQQYALLKKEKTLEAYMNSDGLLSTGSLRDIVDWPTSERDGYVFSDVNTVVNSFWCYTLGLMADIATVLGNTSDATRYRTMQTTATAALNAQLFNTNTGLYVDGQGVTHSALHANLFPLAFGLVPASHMVSVVSYVKSRGMACSVYGAQYLLEGLYRAQEPDAALALLTATSDRSWLGMISAGSTITLEAWADRYISSENYDWNHAWGAAPANILPRFILGVQPLTPGFGQALVQPQPGSLTHVEGTVPTVRGPIRVSLDTQPFKMIVDLPANMSANLAVPTTIKNCTPLLDGAAAMLTMTNGTAFINGVGSGQHVVSCQ